LVSALHTFRASDRVRLRDLRSACSTLSSRKT
jgi:hypothetical protein